MRAIKVLVVAIVAGLFLPAIALAQHVTDAAQATPLYTTYEQQQLANIPVAAPAATVTVVPADVVQTTEQSLPAILAAAIFAVMLRFAGPFAFVLKMARADQIIEKYAKGIIDDWLDHHPEWRQVGITIDVKKMWIATIAQQVISIAPGWLIKFLGGKEAIFQKVQNRIPDIIKDTFPQLFNHLYTGPTPPPAKAATNPVPQTPVPAAPVAKAPA